MLEVKKVSLEKVRAKRDDYSGGLIYPAIPRGIDQEEGKLYDVCIDLPNSKSVSANGIVVSVYEYNELYELDSNVLIAYVQGVTPEVWKVLPSVEDIDDYKEGLSEVPVSM